MKTRICLFFKIVTFFLVVMGLSGCWDQHELNELAIVMGVGIDKSGKSDEVQLTAQVVRPGGIKPAKSGSTGNEEAFWNVKNTDTSVLSALRGLTLKTSRQLYFPHNQVLIFSRSIAEDGVQKYIDFFTRNSESRFTVQVLVSRSTAEEVLDVKSGLENIPASNIAKLIDRQSHATAQSCTTNLKDFSTRLMSKTTAPIAPFIEIIGDGANKSVILSGTAIFKRDKLVGELDKTGARGLLWVLGEVKKGIIDVNGPNNDKVSLETTHASSIITPEIIDNKIYIRVDIREEGTIGTQTGSENLAQLPSIAFLEKEKSTVIQSEVMTALRKAQELNADIFGFGDAVHQKYPEQWKQLEDRWDEIFPNIEIEVNVEAKLRLMGRLSKPVVPE
jgi:spore germination protein KC